MNILDRKSLDVFVETLYDYISLCKNTGGVYRGRVNKLLIISEVVNGLLLGRN